MLQSNLSLSTHVDLVNEVVKDIIKKCGNIDLLFNSAGILYDVSLENVKEFNELINVNLKRAFNVLHCVVPYMNKFQQGYIFNLASLFGKVGYACIGAYTASKFGLVGLSESLFHKLSLDNVVCACLCKRGNVALL